MRITAIATGVLGGIFGIVSAIYAIVVVGADPVYSGRLPAAWLALLLAVLAGVVAMFIQTRPITASLAMLIVGLIGFVCINLFYINTFYGLALLLWIIATALTLSSTRMLVSPN